MIAFSTDVSVASPGVYLLSFLIQGLCYRILQFAASQRQEVVRDDGPPERLRQHRRRRFQQIAGGLNAQVVVTARYAPGQRQDRGAADRRGRKGEIDALFIPDQADGMPASHALAASGIKT